jgi:hypothetical protein
MTVRTKPPVFAAAISDGQFVQQIDELEDAETIFGRRIGLFTYSLDGLSENDDLIRKEFVDIPAEVLTSDAF